MSVIYSNINHLPVSCKLYRVSLKYLYPSLAVNTDNFWEIHTENDFRVVRVVVVGTCACVRGAPDRRSPHFSTVEQPPSGFLLKPVAIVPPPPPLSVLIRRFSPLLPHAPDSPLSPSPLHPGRGLLDPSSGTPCQPHLPFRFPVHHLHWSRHSLSPPCPFRPSSILHTSVGPRLLIPSAFYTPPAIN